MNHHLFEERKHEKPFYVNFKWALFHGTKGHELRPGYLSALNGTFLRVRMTLARSLPEPPPFMSVPLLNPDSITNAFPLQSQEYPSKLCSLLSL